MQHSVLLWNKAKNPVFNPKDMGVDLDQAFRTIYSTLIVLSGKDDADKNIMRNRIINIIGRLLGGKDVDVAFIKQLMVSRFPGLFSNSQWVNRFGFSELRKMMAILEFLNRANNGR